MRQSEWLSYSEVVLVVLVVSDVAPSPERAAAKVDAPPLSEELPPMPKDVLAVGPKSAEPEAALAFSSIITCCAIAAEPRRLAAAAVAKKYRTDILPPMSSAQS